MSSNPTRPGIPIEQFWRFVATGLMNTAAHAVVAVSIIKLGLGSLITANVWAYVVATILSYFINTTWSFSGEIGGDTFARFLAVSLIGLCLAAAVSWIAEQLGLHYFLGIACVPIFVTPVTFTLHKVWTYR